MKRCRNLLVLFILVTALPAMVVATASREAATDDILRVSVLGKIQTGSRTSTGDVLTPMWREKAGVIPEVTSIPPGDDPTSWLQMNIVGGTVPQIIAVTNGIFDSQARYDLVKDAGILREVKLEDLERYMPLFAERLAGADLTIEDWYRANADPRDGKLWYVPGIPNPVLFAEARQTELGQNHGPNPYWLWFRDDVLQMIFPEAKTEAELKALYEANGGTLTPEDVFDVPIRTREDLTDYLRAVKALDLKQDGKPIIPGLVFMNESTGSIMWSNFTAAGFWWGDLADRPWHDVNRTMHYFAATPEWKEHIRWLNALYNDGLIDPETFIQRDDQRNAKVINGEYAVFQQWLPVGDARTLAAREGRGYGFRMVPTYLLDLDTAYQTIVNEYIRVSTTWGAIGVTTKIAEADLPRIYGWIDWMYSEEAAELRAWGTPEMSTGRGMSRRFKPEYADVEAYMLSGTAGSRDGIHYGLIRSNTDSYFNWETHFPISTGEFEYVYSPRFVYPKGVDSFDSGVVSVMAARQYYRQWRADRGIDQYLFRELPIGDDARAARAKFTEIDQEWSAIMRVSGFGTDEGSLRTIQAITGRPEDFERNYANYERVLTPELFNLVERMRVAWFNYRRLYHNYVVPFD